MHFEGEFRVHQLPMGGDQIPCRRLRSFLIAAESDDEIALGHEPLGLEPQEGLGQQGHFLFDIRRPAAVEETVLLGETVGIPLPIAALRGDHVHMRNEGNRFSAAAIAPVAHDQGRGLTQRQDMDVGGGKAAGLEAFREILGHEGHFPLADRAFDAHDVGKDLARLGAHGLRRRHVGMGGHGGVGGTADAGDGIDLRRGQARTQYRRTQTQAQASQSYSLHSSPVAVLIPVLSE